SRGSHLHQIACHIHHADFMAQLKRLLCHFPNISHFTLLLSKYVEAYQLNAIRDQFTTLESLQIEIRKRHSPHGVVAELGEALHMHPELKHFKIMAWFGNFSWFNYI